MFISNFIKASILRFLARHKPINFEIKNTKKILFLRYDRIGDMIITTPIFRELKDKFPHVSITVLASKSNHEVLINNPYIDNIVINNKNNFIADLPSLLRLRKQKFDVCVEFDHSVVPHAILRLKVIKSKKNISIKKEGRYGVSGDELTLYDIYTEKPQKRHFRDIWLGLLEPFGIKPQSNNYDLFISEKLNDKSRQFLKQFSSNFLIGINLEGAVQGKKITFSELEKICKELYKFDNKIKIIILCPPKNFLLFGKKIEQMGLSYVEISYKTNTFLDVSALVSHLDLIITPDTSISHVASAFNIPVVTIHENNQDSYELFAPVSELNRTVFSKSTNSLNGFSLDELIFHSSELIELSQKEKNE